MTIRFKRLLNCGCAAVALSIAGLTTLTSAKDPAALSAMPGSKWPIGVWRVEFANGVAQTSDVAQDGTASVVEPGRSSPGKVIASGRAVMIVFEDDRIERWTPVGNRQIVEHWGSTAQWPTSPPVLGIADRTE
jgi:hypothetical protein